jgi:hypothetical protein
MPSKRGFSVITLPLHDAPFFLKGFSNGVAFLDNLFQSLQHNGVY